MGRFHRRFTLQVEEGEFIEAQVKNHLLRLAGSQSYPLKPLKASHRLLDACPQIPHIALNDFGGRAAPRVGHGRRGIEKRSSPVRKGLREGDSGLRYVHMPIGEAGIGKPEAEGEERAVGDIDVAGEEA